MLQTLFHIPREIAGFPVFGFGLALGVWVLFGLVLLARLVRRQGLNADTWSYVPLLALVAAAIIWLLPAICDAEGLPIRGYGVMLLLGIMAATGLLAWRARRVGLDPVGRDHLRRTAPALGRSHRHRNVAGRPGRPGGRR